MAIEVTAQNAQVRRTTEFHGSVWGDYFITHTSHHEIASSCSEQIEVLKEKVRRMFTTDTVKPSQKLNLVDEVQRLGIAYHFKPEMEQVLEQIQNTYEEYDNDEDLYYVALRFRLLRQQGYNVSSNMFNKFKDGKGNFKGHLVNDVRGMLSLYEASYLSVRGEDILDEAREFTTRHLSAMVSQLSAPLADQVSHALKCPIRKGFPRIEAWCYFFFYSQTEGHNETLLRLAKLDFNMLQKLHQKELSHITKWWNDTNIATKLPFVRDRLIEGYFWAFGLLPEPKFAFAGRLLLKVVEFVTVMDDIYDVHGTTEELELFTKAAERWEISMKDELPDYMKIFYQVILDFFDEIEAETSKEGRSYCVHYVKEAMKNQALAYMTEIRWFNQGYVPTLEEYLRAAMISATYPVLITTAFCGMGEVASKEVCDWLFTEPKFLMAAMLHARLRDDIVSHKFEQPRGHVASAVECYMKQYGVSQQEAEKELRKLVDNSWKDMNQELLKPVDVPMPILTCILDIVRATEAVYKDKDCFTDSKDEVKRILIDILVNPVIV